MARRLKPEGEWSELHRRDLMLGADGPHNRFGQRRVSSRRREGHASDFTPDTMPLARMAWEATQHELLASVDDSRRIWAYRRFELDEPH